MPVLIRAGNDYLELVCVENVPEPLPTPGDFRLAVSVQSGSFAGSSDAVWISSSAFAQYLTELRLLEQSRQGIVELLAMSPAEIRLCIQSIDRAGHMVVEGEIARLRYLGRQQPFMQRLTFAFDFDSGDFTQIVRDFERLSET